MESISIGDFSCETTKNDVIYRTVINGTSNTLLAPRLINAIQQWIANDGTFLVDLMRMRVRKNCPLRIDSLSEKECTDGTNSEDEVEGVLSSGSIGKCFDQCVQSECSRRDG